MRSADYSYPPDEFDAAANAGGPRGAHRTPRSKRSRWWPFVVALVVFPLLAFGIVVYLSGSGSLSSATDLFASGGSADSAAVESTEATEPEAEAEAEDETAESVEPVPEPEPTEPAVTVPPADLARTVQVMNSTQTAGLAGGARSVLESGGFTDVSTGNWNGADTGTSVVYYPEATDLGTASEAAAQLGIARVEEDSAHAGGIIMVVLETDYQP